MLHNEVGTKEDLVRYRLETAKSDVNSANILLEAGEFRGTNNRAYYGIYLLLKLRQKNRLKLQKN